jgi:hypothetical protein
MKKLLRSSLFVLMLLGCYAGFNANLSSATAEHLPQLPMPPAR